MAGHWSLHGAGMFAVEEKSSGKFIGRVGPWLPPAWPDFDRENAASQGVARRLGAERDREIELFGHVADVWVTSRRKWKA